MAISPIGFNPVNKASIAKGKEVSFGGVLEKIVSSKGFETVAKFAAEKPAVFNSASSLVLAGALRPATIMLLPGKGENAKKNKATAAAHAISSAVIGFAITSTVMKPISAGLKKVMGNTEKYLPKLSKKMAENPAFATGVNKILSFGPDILLAIPRAILTTKLSSIVKEKLFDRKKPEAVQQPQVQTMANAQRPVLETFKQGGAN